MCLSMIAFYARQHGDAEGLREVRDDLVSRQVKTIHCARYYHGIVMAVPIGKRAQLQCARQETEETGQDQEYAAPSPSKASSNDARRDWMSRSSVHEERMLAETRQRCGEETSQRWVLMRM